MNSSRRITVLVATLSLMTAFADVVHADGSVSYSNGAWRAYVNGNEVWSGNRYFDAVNQACGAAGEGSTIHIYGSGSSQSSPGGLYYIRPLRNQILDFHGNTLQCTGGSDIVGIYQDRRSGLTVRNVTITGNPRYAIWLRGSNDIVLQNINVQTTAGLGIRVNSSDPRPGSTTRNSGLTMSNITVNGPSSHGIEVYSIDNINIDEAVVSNCGHSGVLLNDCNNTWIGAIYATNCGNGTSYAGFRQANKNGTVTCEYLYARNCGRGLYSVSDSHGCTVEEVDIANCEQSGISVSGTSYNFRVNSGTVSNSVKNVDIWNGATDVCIKVNGGIYGDACSGSGFFHIGNRSSGKYLRVENGSSSDGAYLVQEDYNSGYWSQQFELEPANGYYRIRNRNSGKYLRVENGSSADGARIVQETLNTSYWSQQFSLIDLGSGYFQIQNRSSGKCLRVENSSQSNGAYIIQETSNSSYWSQQFSFD